MKPFGNGGLGAGNYKMKRIKVRSGGSVFWVTNPKKIKYWLGIAKTCTRVIILKEEK